ncbi:MAG: ABC transporter substrate-binding protein [Sphaerochaeta sp.]|jgi:multiple sugar transport system substrate-binding protein|nr:ABC transporter substrate-binding protein [Sphaerochaeta sp.]
MKKVSIMLLIGVMVIGSLFAQGSNEKSKAPGKQTVVFWNGYTGPDRTVLEELVKKYNESQNTVEIKMEIMPWDTLYQKLMPAMIAGNAPDLIAMSVGRYMEYAQAGKLANLDDLLASSSLKRDDLVPGLMNAGMYQGSQYAMPMAFAAMVMYYNKDMFTAAGLDPDNPPKTLTELQDAWAKLVKKDANGNVTQYAQAIGVKSTVAMIPVFMWMYGAEYIQDGKSVLNSPEAVQALEMLAQAFQRNVSPVGLTGQEADNLFSAGKAAIEFNGPWAIPGFRGAGINLGIAEVPAGKNGRKTWGGDTILSISKDSKVKEAAWNFIEYWNSVEAQRTWALKVGFPPTRVDMSGDKELLAGNPDIIYFLNSAKYAEIFMADQPKSGRIDEEILVPLYEAVTRGTTKPAEALQAADAKLNALLAEK